MELIPHIRILAYHSWREQLRNKSFAVALLFSAVILYVSLLLGTLAVDQELRVLLDFGLGFIELMALFMAVYGAATAVLREIETKTIYLILTRPISRADYLIGRFMGLFLSVLSAILAMGAVHLAVLKAKGWAFDPEYLLAVLGIVLKLAVATALAGFWALASTSVLSALTITGIVWTLGNFLPEIEFLVRRTSHHWAAVPMLGLTYLLPNLQLFNFRDRLDVPATALAAEPVAAALLYAVGYSAACIALSYAFFRKKEF